METQDKDVMAKIALVVGSLVLLAVVIFLVVRLLSVINANSTKGADADADAKSALVAERIKPIGSVTTGKASAGPVNRSGKEIVAAVCSSCHGAGVLGAPKIGDSAAWGPRYAKGIDTLLDHATKGFNSMPARGGDASLSDTDVKKAIVHMLKESGQTVSASDDVAEEAPAAPAASDAAPADESAAPAAATSKDMASEAAAPAAPVAAPEAAIAGDEMTESAGNAVDESAKAVKAEGSSAPVAAAAAPANDSGRGKEVYSMACFSCHDTGVAGAPKLGDSAAWAPRIATGMDSLYHTAINGRGAMPPKGGRVDLPDADIEATVRYMVSSSQ